MIPNAQARDVTSQGVKSSGSFGISLKDTAHIMTILRDTLYSDKVLAILREYSSNAWDANRAVGKADTPIKVTMPTSVNPTLVIEDCGPGLSKDDVFNVYTQYGASTKRGTDNAVGMLGIGSKSGFAYSDSFTIVSSHGGKACTYVAVIDESEAGAIQLIHEKKSKKTGVQIQISVKAEDIAEFNRTALTLFQHFKPRPSINITLPPLPEDETVLTNGSLSMEGREWVAIMGCVPYRVNLDQLRGMPESIGGYIHRMSGTLNFPIGAVEVSASREELKYSKGTKEAIVKRINGLVAEFVQHTLDNIDGEDITIWEKRVKAQILGRMDLPVPKKWQDYTKHAISLKLQEEKRVKFSIISGTGTQTSSVPISDRTRFLMGDVKKKLKGFGLGSHDLIVRPILGVTLDEAEKALKKLLKKRKLTGIPISMLSTIPWTKEFKADGTPKIKNKKHTVKTFELIVPKVGYGFYSPWSTNWAINKRVPDDKDVFVILSGFQTKHSSYDFYRLYNRDKKTAAEFGLKLPPVYGYKTTEKKPITAAECKGMEYREWRKTFIKEVLALPEAKRIFDCWMMVQVRSSSYSYWHKEKHNRGGERRKILRKATLKAEGITGSSRRRHPDAQLLTDMIKALGKDHKITKFYIRRTVAKNVIWDTPMEKLTVVRIICDEIQNDMSDEDIYENHEETQVTADYPLLASASESRSHVWGGDASDEWARYVHLIDKDNRKNN